MYRYGIAIRSGLNRPRNSDNHYIRRINGVVATLGWILDKSLLPPLTDHARSANGADQFLAISREIAAANHSLEKPERTPGDHAYATGVRDTLHWASHAGTDAPC